MNWVDVNDALPKKRGKYLAFTPEQEVMGVLSMARRNVLEWTGSRWRSSFHVSHWAELPPAPQPRKDGEQ